VTVKTSQKDEHLTNLHFDRKNHNSCTDILP
jgi:hypothetical protein